MTTRTRVLVAGLVATCAPLLLILFNRDWFLTPEGYLDPWLYVGFFRQYEDLDFLPEDYKLARLPWILVGYGVTRTLPPIPAAYVLHAIFLCGTPLALFGWAYTLFRRPAFAAFLALWLGFYTHAHGSGGWDYHTTAAGLFFFSTAWIAVLPSAIQGRPAAILLAGGAAALTAHSDITLVNVLPALVYVHFLLVRVRTGPQRGRALVGRVFWALLGGILVTLLLGAINWKVGRDFVFFRHLVDLVLRYLTNPELHTGRPIWDLSWVLNTSHLALPAAVFIAGAAVLISSRRSPRDADERVSQGLIIQFICVALVWIVWQQAGQVALDSNYMAYGLIPSVFMGLGGLLNRAWPISLERRCIATVLGTASVFSLALIFPVPGFDAVKALVAPASLLAGCFLLLAALAVYFRRPSTVSVVVVALTFAVVNPLMSYELLDYEARDPCKVRPAVYKGIVDAATWLMTVDPLYNRVRIWFDEDELVQPLRGCHVGLGLMGYSIRSMSSLGYVTPPYPMPRVNDVPQPAIVAMAEPGRILAIVSDGTEQLEAWSQRLADLGLAHEEFARHRVPVMESGFTVYAWIVTPRPQ